MANPNGVIGGIMRDIARDQPKVPTPSWLKGGEDWLDEVMALPFKITPRTQESFNCWMASLSPERRHEILVEIVTLNEDMTPEERSTAILGKASGGETP